MAYQVSRLEVQDGISGPMAAAAAAMDKAAGAAEQVEWAVARVGPGAEALIRRFDEGTRATLAYEKAQRALAQASQTMAAAVAEGRASEEQRAAVLDSLRTKVGAAAAAMAATSPTLNKLASDYDQAAAAAAKYQAAVNNAAGIRLPSADASASRAADIAAYGAELDRLRAKFNPVFAVSKQYEATLDEIAQAQKLGAISAAEAAQAIERETAAFARANAPLNQHGAALAATAQAADKAAANHTQAAFAVRNLGLQSIDLFQGLASGQPILTTFVQQGGQVVQVAAAGGVGFGQLARGVVGAVAAINPLVAIGAVAVASLAALAVSSEAAERRLLSMQTALRATRTDYEAMGVAARDAAQNIAATTGFSGAEARAAAQAIGAERNFTGTRQDMEALIRTAGDLSAVIGKTLPEAARELAGGLRDPAAMASKLANEHFPGMSQALAYSIKLMADGGDKAGAFGKVLDALRSQTSGAADAAKTDLQRALDNLGKAFISTADGSRSFADSLGSVVTSAAASAIDSITRVAEAIQQAWDYVNSLNDKTKAAGGPSLSEFVGAAMPFAVPNTSLFPGAGAARSWLFGVTSGPPPAAATPGARIAPSSQLTTPVANQLYAIAEANNFAGSVETSAMQADLATRMAFLESRGRQDVMSGKGAVGIMGLMPGTARDMGVNAFDAADNIKGGLKYIAQLWSKYGGDPALVAMAYNWGPGNVDAFLAGTNVPGETRSYVKAVAGVDVNTIATSILPVPPIPPGSAAGAANTSARDDAFALARQIGGLTFDREQNQAKQKMLQDGLAVTSDPAEIARLSDALAELRKQEYDLVTEQQKLARSAVDATRALSQQGEFAREMAKVDQQFAEAARRAGVAVDEKALAMARAARQVELQKPYEDLITATERQTEAQLRINAAYDGTADSVSRAQNRETALAAARGKYAEGSNEQAEAVTRYAAALDAGAAAARDFEQRQASVAAVSNTLTNAFDRVGQAMVDAFVSGQGHAVNLGNVLKGVASSVLSDFAKLAVINPILNSILPSTGGLRPTLGAAVGALSGGGPSTGSDGGFSTGNLSSIFSGGEKAWNFLSNGFSGFTNSIETASPWLNSVAADLAPSLFNLAPSAAYAALPAGVQGPVLTGGALTGTTFSGFAGGVGLGFGAGSLAGGLLQGALNKTGPAPTIGAGVGALAGAAIGSIIPGIGTIVGGLIGGLLGGSGGAFIGPRPPSAYSSTGVTAEGGQLSIGRTLSQIVDTSQEVDRLRKEVAAVNQTLAQFGGKVVQIIDNLEIGQNTPGGFQDPEKFPDLFSANQTGKNALQGMRFEVADPDLNRAIAGKSFASLDEFNATLNAAATAIAAYNKMLNETVPAAKTFGEATGSVNDSLKTVAKTFNDQIDAAEALIHTGYLNEKQISDLTAAEQELGAAREKAVAATNKAAAQQIHALDIGLTTRVLAGKAANTNDPRAALDARLYAFDFQAQQEKDALATQLVGMFGEAFRDSEAFAVRMTHLERALGEERLSIARQFNDQIAATAAAGVSSLSSYVTKLNTSGASPLSPLAQYSLASQQFDAVAGAAAAGDFNSVQKLTGYADALLAGSRVVNGSGAGYAADFARVLEVIGRVSSAAPDTLTASVLAAETRTQTQQLTDALAEVRKAVEAVRAQLQQGSAAPARIAA